MIKTVNKLSIEGMYTNIRRPYMTSPQVAAYSLLEKESFSSKTRKKTRMSIFTTFIQYYSKSSQSN